MVFAPPYVGQAFTRPSTIANNPQAKAERTQLTNLFANQFSAYALIASRSVGDQPGRPTPRYVTEWRHLPEGTLFAPYKLLPPTPASALADEYTRAFPTNYFPFPRSSSALFPLPCIGFNAQGQLLSPGDAILTLAKGSVFYGRLANGNLSLNTPPDVQLNPPINARLAARAQTNSFQFLRINWLTGRARVESQGVEIALGR
jgi:hypothetical protein